MARRRAGTRMRRKKKPPPVWVQLGPPTWLQVKAPPPRRAAAARRRKKTPKPWVRIVFVQRTGRSERVRLRYRPKEGADSTIALAYALTKKRLTRATR